MANLSRTVWTCSNKTGEIITGTEGVTPAISWEIAVREVRAYAGPKAGGRGWFVNATGAVCFERGEFIAMRLSPTLDI